MSEAKLNVELRTESEHNARVIRRNGRVPGIYYAHDQKNIQFTADAKELARLMHREVTVLNMVVKDGDVKKTIIRAIQLDPVTEAPMHIDLLGIKLDEAVKLTIPIILTGTPAGVKEGGILEHLLREVELEGLPLDIPEHIELDVSHMNIGDVLNLDVISSDKFTVTTERNHPVAHVLHPKVTEEVADEIVSEEVETESEEKTE